MLASEVMDRSAALLNDTAKSIFTYTAQIPYLNIALTDLAQLLELNNVGITNKTSQSIILPANSDVIPLPADLVEIQQVWQRTNSTLNGFTRIQKFEFLPQYLVNTITSFIPAWSWQDELIKVIPANTILDIRLDYIKNGFPTVTASTDSISMINGLNFLAYRTAGHCALYIGENPTRADQLYGEAILSSDLIMGISSKGKQSIATRRRPFMAGYRTRSGSY